MSSPMKLPHSQTNVLLVQWLAEYAQATPGTAALSGATHILGPKSEPEPDGTLLVLPEFGGQARFDENQYLHGAPEWVGEIGDSSESIDLHSKKVDYEQAGVREYMVAALQSSEVCWFVRRRGKFRSLPAGEDGVFRSVVFPGLWLNAAALLENHGKRLLKVLRLGLASAEHSDFVAKLSARKS